MRVLPLLFLCACFGGGDVIGTPCKLDKAGALGFGFDDPCATKCLALTSITCPDGTTVRKEVCAGAARCDPGTCGTGEVCYSLDDPFEKYAYCVPDDICGASLSAADGAAWERASRTHAETVQAEWAAKKARMEGAGPTKAAEPVRTAP